MITDQPVFRREGEYWTIAFAGEVRRLRDRAGMRQLAYLLARPGEWVSALDLVRETVATPAACANRHPHDRQAAAERARVRVTHAIRHALARIAEHHAELNEHLRATIRTGTRCAYLPDPRLPRRWKL